VNGAVRRGWCPGLSSPMRTGDGLLVRFLPADHIPIGSLIALCAAARRHGNGTVEVTARGSLQMRGFTACSAAAFARDVEALTIPAAAGVPVVADPLPEDPDCLIDATKLAMELRAAIAQARLALAAKICVIVDGGGRLHLDALSADLRLRALPTQAGPQLHVAIAGDARSAIALGCISPERAPDFVVRLLAVVAQQGAAARARDCIGELRKIAIEGCDEPPPLPSRPPAAPIGIHALRNGGVALGVAPVFGHAQAEAFCELARIAALYGGDALRPAPGRALLLIGLDRDGVNQLVGTAQALGFVVRADDPRRHIIACPGSPACASGMIAARQLAADIAPHVPALRSTIHISGCPKGCAHPAPAALTIVGTQDGCGIVRHGSAHVPPSRYIQPADLVAEVVRTAHEMGPASDRETQACSLSQCERDGVRG
jgi:precorrin-3B synthase